MAVVGQQQATNTSNRTMPWPCLGRHLGATAGGPPAKQEPPVPPWLCGPHPTFPLQSSQRGFNPPHMKRAAPGGAGPAAPWAWRKRRGLLGAVGGSPQCGGTAAPPFPDPVSQTWLISKHASAVSRHHQKPVPGHPHSRHPRPPIWQPKAGHISQVQLALALQSQRNGG